MSDRDALLRAICEYPDDDTPRLVFADWLDENDEPQRAAFIRAQVELARTPPWEPFAVRCRWRQPDLVSGDSMRDTLPRVDGFHVEWANPPFRRGFGWALLVRNPSLWDELAEPLFAREPIGAVSFGVATLGDWKRIAASDSVKHFRHLAFVVSPIEPLWALRDVPEACGITDLHFHRSSGAGMPEVVEDLFASALGRAVRGLHFHTGYESLGELMEALVTGGPLERLSFSNMGLSADHLRRLLAAPISSSLTELHLVNERPGPDGLPALADGLPLGLRDLELVNVGVHADGLEALARCERAASLRRLSLSRNPLQPRAVKVLSLSRALAGLRSLDLSQCRIGDRGVRHVTRAKFWLNLVELDLRKNPLSSAGVKRLLDAPVPPELTALVLDGDTLGNENRAALSKKYGDAVVFAPSELPA